jgi:hypothetical protein
MSAVADVVAMDDPTLIAERGRIRAEIEGLPPRAPQRRQLEMLYDVSSQEIDHRARAAWSAA